MIFAIHSFRGSYSFLSNFYTSRFTLEGTTYLTVEHAFQAAKALDLFDQETILLAETAEDAKHLGRLVSLRPDWELVKEKLMYNFVNEKFKQNEEIKQKLFKTGNSYLEEGNMHGDTEWGVCKGKGKNLLGKILMRVRAELYTIQEMKKRAKQ